MLGKFIHPAAPKSTHIPAEPPALMDAHTANPAPLQKPAPREEGNKLIVGPNIKLKGSEITDCEILVVEGRVEACMHSRDIRIAEGGVFSGKAEIDVAEIRGRFEGELTVRKRLTIYATGKVTGKILYGALTIEEGGMLSGEIGALPEAARPAIASAPSEKTLPTLPLAEIAQAPHPYRPPVLSQSPLGGRRN